METQLTIELIEWLDEMVDKRAFANRSHGVEVCLIEYRRGKQRRDDGNDQEVSHAS